MEWIEERDRSAIFSGLVVYEGPDTALMSIIGSYRKYPYVYIFRGYESWKGLDSSMSHIKLYGATHSCGYHFELGKEYLVFSNVFMTKEIGVPMHSALLCAPTTLLKNASVDLELLGKSKRHDSDSIVVSVVDNIFDWFSRMWIVIVLIVGLIMLFLYRI